MTLFERKAIDWLKSLDNPRKVTDESYYAQLILAMIDSLDEQSVSDLLSRIDELEGEVERLRDILDDAGIVVCSECEV
jgi:hypothetical protein